MSKTKQLLVRSKALASELKTKTILGSFTLALVYQNAFADEGKDLLEPLKGTIQKTFGPGSMVFWILLLAEGIFTSVLFIKSKNPMTLLSFPVMVAMQAGITALLT